MMKKVDKKSTKSFIVLLDCFQDLVEGMARGKLSSYNTKTFFVHDYHLWIQIDNTVCSGQRLVEYFLIKCIIHDRQCMVPGRNDSRIKSSFSFSRMCYWHGDLWQV